MNYFKWNCGADGKYVPVPDWEVMGIKRIDGSGLLIPARFFGLDWITYLRYCRQNGARLIGKNHNFIRPCWDTPNEEFMNRLNKRISEVAKIIDLGSLKY